MKIALVALSGVRVRNEQLVRLGVTLPGFVRRGQVIASLPSLGLLTVAGLTPPEHDVSYIEVEDVTVIGSQLNDFDLVGISSFTAKINDAYRLADTLRGRGVPVVLGGLHVSAVPDEALSHADAIVVGGAEGAWPALLRDLERGALERVYQGATNGVFSSEVYAMPRFNLLAGRAYNRITVQTSRGCPRRCEFCAASLRITERFQQKPVELVMAELRHARRFFPEPFVEFADDNTFLDRRWAKRFLAELEREELHYFTETDASVADDLDLCDRIAASGCRQLLIGFESPFAGDLLGIDPSSWKRRRAPELARVVDALQSRGVSVNGCFILGLDSHTPEVFPKLLEVVESSGLAEVQFTVLTPFPGTPLHRRLKAEGRLLEDAGWDERTLFDVTYRPKRMSVEELRAGLRFLFENTYTRAATRARQRNFVRQKRCGPAATACGRTEPQNGVSQSLEEPRQLVQLGRPERAADLVPMRQGHSSAE